MSNDKISGVGINIAEKATLQADNFLNFSITVPSYEEQKEKDTFCDIMIVENILRKKVS